MTTAVGAGNHYSLFFKDGVVFSVGENNESQLGRGEVTETGTGLADMGQVNLPEGFTGEIVAISAGMLHGAFLTAAGEVYTWGDNNLGKLGQGTTTNYESLMPTKVAALDGVVITKIWMSNGASYALSDDGQLYAWGQNTNGQLGNGALTNTGTPIAISKEAFGGADVTDLAYGTSFALVLTEDGKVWAFGGNVQGQLGPNGVAEDGSFIRRSAVPLEVDIPGTVVHVSAGTNTAFAITDDGKVWGWGQSDFGQLLKGTIVDGQLTEADTGNSAIPQEIQGLPPGVVDIHIGSRWVIALTESGEVWAWGRNDEGWLGLESSTGAIETLIAPTRIPGFEGIDIVSIIGGPNHALAVDSDGNVWGWGNMNQSRLATTQAAGTWASGPILIPLDPDGRKVVIGTTEADAALQGGDLAEGETGFSIYGFGGDDSITGSAGTDMLTGGVGDDTLLGQSGDDILKGSQGADLLQGGDGQDSLFAGTGDDALDGGAGNDLLQGGEGADSLLGGDGADTLDGRADDDLLQGGLGQDQLIGDSGNDLLQGGAEADTLGGGEGDDRLDGGLGGDLLAGDTGNDTLHGRGDRDTIAGGDGDDLLTGGRGIDRMSGGQGADRFVFAAKSDFAQNDTGRELISDFQRGQGDIIDLGGVDANGRKAGDQAFSFVGTKAFSGTAGELRFVKLDGSVRLEGDLNGDGKADILLRLDGVARLIADDFIL
jgi:alpha-tubulin suppressor-like RCC1 family protein